MKSIILLIIQLSIFNSSCKANVTEKAYLSNDNICLMISICEMPQSELKTSVHFQYLEHFNDSTWHINILTSTNFTPKNEAVHYVTKCQKMDVFVYDDNPFWIPDSDGISKNFIVKRRGSNIIFYPVGHARQTYSEFELEEYENTLKEVEDFDK